MWCRVNIALSLGSNPSAWGMPHLRQVSNEGIEL